MNRHVYSDAFEQFWALYPRRTGKLAAWRVWERVSRKSPVVTEDGIIAALQKQLDGGHFSTDVKFVPHPRTWLNQGRWDDEVEKRNAGAGHAAPEKGKYDGLY